MTPKVSKMVKATIDRQAFDQIFKDYLKFSRRELMDTLNQKAYFIAANATQDTMKVEQERIERELRSPATVNSKAPIAAVLVNLGRGRAKKKGLTGQRMSAAVEKFINARKRSAAYVASTWIGALKALAPFVKSRQGKKQDPKTKQRGMAKGGASPVRNANGSVQTASIWSDAKSKETSTSFNQVLQDGAQNAFDREAVSMLQYISKKLDAYKKR